MMVSSRFQAAIHVPTYLKTYLFLKRSQWWNKDRWDHYQSQQLKKLLHHCYTNVPYYKKLFDEHKLHPSKITTLQDLQTIPLLTKEIIRQNRDRLKASNYPAHAFESFSTGGSTGQPLRFFIEKGVYFATMRAYGTIQNEWTNHRFFDKSLIIIGQKDLFKYARCGRTLTVSSFNITKEDFPRIIQKIKAFQLTYLLSYPSSLAKLASYLKNNTHTDIPHVHSIICIAETLYPWQRTLIEETFHCRVYEQYCQRESVAFGLHCSHTNMFHMFPQFGIVELLGKDGTPVTKEDEIGEIVGTSLHNYIFPFIRYKTGDLGVYTTQHCPCRRQYPLIKRIQGRTQEFVLSKTNQPFALTGIYDLVAKSTPHIQDCQFYQDTPGTLLLNIIPTPQYTEQDTQKIQQNFKKIMGNRLNLTIHHVDHIPLTSSGKYQFLIQKIPIEFTG
jgi:phenylacetate-CoA ligase